MGVQAMRSPRTRGRTRLWNRENPWRLDLRSASRYLDLDGVAVRRKPRPNKQIVAFKVEPELAALLDAMPNKSEFIRNAVARQLSTACPLCRGTGITPYSGISDELTRLVQQHPLCVCAGCGVKVPRPCHTPGHCEEEPRIESFERWGVFYCEGCGPTVAFCDDCHKAIGRAGGRKKPVCESCSAA
jgi:hypothetical protein